MPQKIVIIGAGGLARDTVDIFETLNVTSPGDFEVLGYIVEAPFAIPGEIIYGKPILGDFDWLAQNIEQVKVVCGVGSSELRYRLVGKAVALGATFQSAIHPQAIYSPSSTFGQGVIVKAGGLLASSTRLGDHVVLNLGCTIGHDTSLGDFVTVAAGVNIAGYVNVKTGCHLSIGCKVIEHLEIGEWSFIGSGSVVTKNIPPGMVANGNPARPIRNRHEGGNGKVLNLLERELL